MYEHFGEALYNQILVNIESRTQAIVFCVSQLAIGGHFHSKGYLENQYSYLPSKLWSTSY